jgi:hypothetical protein
MSRVWDPSLAPSLLSRSARHSACKARAREGCAWLRQRSASGRRTIRVCDRDDHEAIDPREVVRLLEMREAGGSCDIKTGLLGTNTLILSARLRDATGLPDQPLISTITLAELWVGPLLEADETKAGSVHTESTRPTALATRPRPRDRRSGRRSSERSIPTACSSPKNALDVHRTLEPRTSLASPISRLGHE